MTRIAGALSRAVLAAPLPLVVAALVLTVVFGAFSGQAEYATGNEGFAPDNPELVAAETIAERFNGGGENVVQVLVEGPEVVGLDGLDAARALTEAIHASEAAEHLAVAEDRPAILHWLTPAEQALADGASVPSSDAAVRGLLGESLASLPAEQAGFLTGLLPDDVTPDGEPRADAGVLLVFLDTDGLVAAGADDRERTEAILELETSLAETVRSVDLPGDLRAEPFSFWLLFGDEDEFQAELGRLFLGAFLIIVLILGIVYWVRPAAGARRLPGTRRTVADVLLTMLTIVMAIVWMSGIGVLLGPGFLGLIGPMNDVSQVVPVLLVGLGVDYAIHLTSRYREELASGGSVRDAIRRATTTVGVALVLATVTTAVGFLTNVFNPVPALAVFGVMAATGIASSFVLMLTFMPAARLLLDRRAERAGRLPRTAMTRSSQRLLPELVSRAAVLAERAAVPTLAVTVLLGGGLGAWGLSQLEVRFSVTDFVSDDAPAAQTMETIIDRFGGGFGESTDVLVTGEVASPAVHNALVRTLDDLAEVPDVATYGGVAQAESPVGLLGLLLAPGPDGAPASAEVASAAATAGVGPDLTVPADADVTALYDALVTAAPEQADRVLARTGEGRFDAARVAISTTAGEGGAADLRGDLDRTLAPVVAAGVSAIATSDEIITDEVVTALSESQLTSMLLTLVVAMALLVVTYWFRNRRPALGVLTVLPVGLVVLWTFAMMAATGIPFGPITATIAALAIGIGVPYTIHITNRYQEDRLLYGEPTEAMRSTLRHTGGALAGSALTTCAGFGILVTSTLTPFRQLGQVTVYAVGFALLAAILVLPSMLVLWDRWHRRRAGPIEPTPAPEVVGV